MTFRGFVIVAGILLGACHDTGDGACVESPTECVPLYEPTFENVYANTIGPKCAVGGSSCHGSGGHHFEFQGINVAYDAFTRFGLVDPDNPGCGSVERRIESDEPSYVMPVGSKLSEAERCAIHLWIQAGAKR